MRPGVQGLRAKIINLLSGTFSDEQFIYLVFDLIDRRINTRPPTQALKLLLTLDGLLYQIQGTKSVEYGGGTHTKHRHTNYHDFFVKRINKDDRVLDIGCGIGAVAYDIAMASAAQVVGVDINGNSIRTARERYKHPNLEFRIGDALESLPEEKFSVVILSNVLEHLPGRPAFLRHVQEIIQPDRLFIRVPVFERDWRVPLKKELGVEWRLDPTHETEYTLESFEEEMNEAGFSIRHLEVRWGEIWAEVTGAE